MPRDDESIPAVVAAAGDDDHAPVLHAVHAIRDRFGDEPAGVLHQDQTGNAHLFDRYAVRLTHPIGIQDFHDQAPARSPSQRCTVCHDPRGRSRATGPG